MPSDWVAVPLRDLLILDQPGAWGDEPTKSDPGVRVLRAADLTRDGRVDVRKAAWRRLSGRDRANRQLLDGDLILERSGGGPGNPVGRVAMVEGLGAVYCNNFCQQLRVDPNSCSPRYVYRTLWHSYTQGVTDRLQFRTTGIRNLDYDGYLARPILLPPLPEQRAIAAVLDSIDGAIEHTDAVIAATERLRDALLHELLTRGVPGWHSAWKDVPGLGTVPASWEVVRLGDVLEAATYGTNAPLGDQGNTLVLRMNNLQQGKIDLSETRRAKLSGKEVAELDLVPGDILFNRTNSLDLVGKIGIVRYLPEQVSFASYLVRLRVDRSLADPYWLAALLDYKGSQDRIRRLATPAVSQANINPTSLKSLSIALPPLEEQATIAGTLDAVDGAVERVRGERAGLQALQASASDALLTGRVRVGV